MICLGNLGHIKMLMGYIGKVPTWGMISHVLSQLIAIQSNISVIIVPVRVHYFSQAGLTRGFFSV